jgi:hypothetical protein
MADDVWAWCQKTNARGRTVTVETKMGRLSDLHPQPVDGDDDTNEGEASSVGSRSYPIGLSAAQRHSARWRNAFELSTAIVQRGS